MKKLLSVVIIMGLCFLTSIAWSAGSCALTSTENITINNVIQRKYITLTCTGDGSIAAYSFSPSARGVRGWYLYSITTDPGTPAPTDNYDITLVVAGEDVAGGLLANRSTSATQTVQISPTTLGYQMMDEVMAITFANNAANPSTVVMKLRFTIN